MKPLANFSLAVRVGGFTELSHFMEKENLTRSFGNEKALILESNKQHAKQFVLNDP